MRIKVSSLLTISHSHIDFYLSSAYLKIVIADLEPPKIMPPNLGRGYREPFKPGYDPRRYVPPKGVAPKTGGPKPNLLAATRKAFKSHACAVASAKDPDLAMRHAKVCKLLFEIEQRLSGHGSTQPNSTKNHSLRLSDTVAKVAPISTVKTPTITPQSIDQNASQVKPDGKDLDDCPF